MLKTPFFIYRLKKSYYDYQQYLKDLETIRFNALPKIGSIELAHEKFDDNGIIAVPQIQS